jgi:hypothetical protein
VVLASNLLAVVKVPIGNVITSQLQFKWCCF